MATAGDYHLSKAIRTYERDRQHHRKPVRICSLPYLCFLPLTNFTQGDRKNKRLPKYYTTHHHGFARPDGNGGTLRAAREKLRVLKVYMHRDAMIDTNGDEEGVDDDWVADVPIRVEYRVDLGQIPHRIAEHKRRKGEHSTTVLCRACELMFGSLKELPGIS
jgi:hypothetical protein